MGPERFCSVVLNNRAEGVGVQALSEEETVAALASNDASTPLESPSTPHTPQVPYTLHFEPSLFGPTS